ncbi:hypothetical protein MKD41_12540 [Lutibacter sp. A64]|uniref:hypothetical protein n=1 Tax=Lutibacter sp. A64 TaxID=2918526 RepID=UPI001F0554BA|nr:hypothetical protein [Lutibacter sp. A64]UMB53159.1 hypothetical protein MKD41_12540 [Lutibacter sp. A64]
MKNLKKLSVVLFATLLSLNFTSCIDDGVSDAVDQVYLAQAEYLKAQAALQEAMAEAELAEATKTEAEAQYQLALAEVQLAMARETDANTAQIEAGTANILAAAEYLAATNAMTLLEKQAELDIYLVELEEDLEIAKSSLAVKMVELAEAIADTKNDLVRGLYGTYSQKMSAASSLYNQKITKLNQIAKQELFLVTGDDVSMAFAKQQLVDALAMLNADLATANAEIARLQALTPSTAQMDVTALEADIATVEAKKDSLGIVLGEKENDVTVAKAAWEDATSDYAEINSKQAEIKAVSDVIEAHEADMKADTLAIAAAQNIIDVEIPALEAAILTAEADAAADVAAAEAAVTAAEGDVATAEALVVTTKADRVAKLAILDDANTALTTADGVLTDANAAKQVVEDDIADLNLNYRQAVNAYTLKLEEEDGLIATQATAIGDQADAQAAYDAAKALYDANPTGKTATDGTDLAANPWPFEVDAIGNHDDAISTTYLEVLTWEETSAGSGRFIPATWSAVGIAELPTVVAPEEAIDYNARTWSGAEGISAANSVNTNLTYYLEVEADDVDVITTALNLNSATVELDAANDDLDAANDAVDSYTTEVAELEADYLYKQSLFEDASVELDAAQAVVDAAQDDVDAAQDDVDAAQADFDAAVVAKNEAIAALGTETTAPTSESDSAIDPEESAYDALYNRQLELLIAEDEAETAVEDAEQALEDKGSVASWEAYIDTKWEEIAEVADLLPSHEAALAHLEEELAALTLSFDLDELLFDPQDHTFTYEVDDVNIGDDLGYIPLLADYLNAITARNAVDALMDACDSEKALIENTIEHIKLYLIPTGSDEVSEDNVADFEEWVATAIEAQEDIINGDGSSDGLIKDIEQAEVDIDLADYDQDAAELTLAEYERELTVIEAKLDVLETSAAAILVRIEALLATE